jgi:hypothetical protein
MKHFSTFNIILSRTIDKIHELTVPWETNIPEDHAIKINRYYELTNQLIRNNYTVSFYAVEVGARGIAAKSHYNLLKDIGLRRDAISSALER